MRLFQIFIKPQVLWSMVIAMLLMIGVAYGYMSFYVPAVGDDLVFINFYHDLHATWKGVPIVMMRFCLWVHPRFADMLFTVVYPNVGDWGMAILNGLLVPGMMIAGMLNWRSRHTSPLAVALFIAAILFTFRWDAIWMEMCAISNCVWGGALCLAMLWLTLRGDIADNRWWQWLLVPLCWVGGAMHEAQGVALAVGLTVYLALTPSWRNASWVRRWMLMALIAGGLFCFMVPSFYSRGSMWQFERQPLADIIFGSGFYVLLLLLSIVVTLIFDRKRLVSMCKSKWIIYAVSSIVGLLIMIYAGYGGRPGWYAQLYALIALFYMIDRLQVRVNSWLQFTFCFILMLAVYVHIRQLASWQHRLSEETLAVIEMIKESKTGVVFMDYTHDEDLPATLMRKVHGVPDDDDLWYRRSMERCFSGMKHIAILPKAAEKIDFDKFAADIHIGRYIISNRAYRGLKRNTWSTGDIFYTVRIGEVDYVATPFMRKGRKFYLYHPIDVDFGSR